MKKLLTLALATALCAPAIAQKFGSTNEGAPTIKQSIEMGGKKMSLNYTAITWADGKTMSRAMDKANGKGFREFINGSAPKSPLATFESSVDCKCGDLMLPAGEYKVFYTITEDCDWQINFQKGDAKPQTMKLALTDNPMEHKRLVMSLHAGDKGAGSYIGFGKKSCMLEFAPAKKKAE